MRRSKEEEGLCRALLIPGSKTKTCLLTKGVFRLTKSEFPTTSVMYLIDGRLKPACCDKQQPFTRLRHHAPPPSLLRGKQLRKPQAKRKPFFTNPSPLSAFRFPLAPELAEAQTKRLVLFNGVARQRLGYVVRWKDFVIGGFPLVTGLAVYSARYNAARRVSQRPAGRRRFASQGKLELIRVARSLLPSFIHANQPLPPARSY